MHAAFDVIIVGAGHAGAQCAIALRSKGFKGLVAIIGDELDPPYERPPLSKEYLSGDKPFDRLLIRPPAYWAGREIELLLGRSVVEVDPKRRTVTLNDGEKLNYGQLVWAAGGDPRRIGCPGHDARGVHYVRRRTDIDKMRTELTTADRIVVIGGGYIGLEAAAVLNKLGKDVVILEQLDRVLARVAGEPLSRFFEREHRRHGVGVRLNEQVECLEEADGAVTGVRLVTGEVLPADIVIVGIGIIPNVAPLIAAGATGGNGVFIDEKCRTSLPGIYAIGDCALHSNRYAPAGQAIRLESVQNAADQADVAADAIFDGDAVYDAAPWFWSHQYEVKLQTIGLSIGYTDIVTRGDPASGEFSLIYLRNGQVIALDCVNTSKDFIQGRKLVEQSCAPPVELLGDPDIPLKSLLPNAPAA
jgi:3-phenylpropionate/trans-cinnamate dioxygenase ferredoxin reductase subunit